MNYNNLAQKTNWLGGSNEFKNIPFFLTSVNIPGMNFSLPEIGGRNGTKMFLGSDTVEFNTLNFTMLLDEDFEIYKSFYTEIKKSLSIKNNTFADRVFDFWINLNNNKGNHLLKYNFFNCRIESIDDIELDTQDDSTEFTLSCTIKFDYYEME